MFDNLSKREKTLATIVFSLLPILVLFFAFTTVTSSYFAKKTKINSLRKQIGNEENRTLEGQLAQERRLYYSSLSLPGGTSKKKTQEAKIEYQGWVDNLVKSLGMKLTTWDRRSSSKVYFNGNDGRTQVFEIHPFSLVISGGNLPQFIKLMHEFEQLDTLHRVTKFDIKPVPSKGAKKTRTGLLKLKLDLELICMADSVPERDFLTSKQKVACTYDQYYTRIAHRNFFGLENQAPKFKGSKSFRKKDNESIKLLVSANDPEKHDLTIELIDSTVEGAVFDTSSKTSGYIKCPKLDPGTYTFLVRVTDNGLPAKSDEQEIKLTVTKYVKPKPPKVVEREDPPPPPPFKHAGQTAVKFVATPVDGIQRVYIRDMLTDRRYDLAEGESFELDDKEWTVISISPKAVEIEVDGKTRKYRVGTRLDEPAT